MGPAALTVHALGWYGSLGGAVDMYVADRVVVPPEFATGVMTEKNKKMRRDEALIRGIEP
jgi:predicted O-linked N-acetylglucosamine transferase (SPINDLY family)